jgi:hypothetical protein
VLVCGLLATVAALLLVFPVGATLWCKADPVVELNGTLVDVTIAIPLEYVPLVNGPVRYEVRTPVGTRRALVVADLGYNGHGTVIEFRDGGGVVRDGQVPTLIRVEVPIDASRLPQGQVVPTQLTVLPHNAGLVVVGGTSARTEAELTILGR